MKTKIEIKSVWRSVLFSFEKEDNTLKDTILEALRSNADLSNADLNCADLNCADLSGADLSSADLRRAALSGADLSNADLRRAALNCADLRRADLSNADLSGADLSSADLRRAALSGADLRGANLSGADHDESTGFLLSQCPSEGSFIGWKKAGEYVVKLKITETAKRSSATTLKCRCSEAEVLGIEFCDGTIAGIKEVCSNKDADFIYRIGEIVSVPDFDENRWNECSSGIHFFIAREMAVKYN